MSFPRYPEYKDSGVEWLGEGPGHWEVVPLGRITADKCDGPFGSGLKSEHDTDEGDRVIRLQNIRGEGFDGSNTAFIDEGYYHSALNGHDVDEGDGDRLNLRFDNLLVERGYAKGATILDGPETP